MENKSTISIWRNREYRGHGENEGEESDGIGGEILGDRKNDFKF